MKNEREKNPFFIATVIALLLPLTVSIALRVHTNYYEVRYYLDPLHDVLGFCNIILLPFVALVLSISGLATARKQGEGVVRCTVCLVIASVQIGILLLWFLVVNPYLSKAKTTPRDYTIKMHDHVSGSSRDRNADIESINDSIDRALKGYPPGYPEKPLEDFFHLTLNSDYSITRDHTEGFSSLGWHIEHNGEVILERNAQNERVLDTKYQWKNGNKGKFTIYLDAYVDGRYQRVSNIIEYTQ